MIPEQLLQKVREKGSDEEYQAYVRQFPSVLTLRYDEFVHGEGRSVFAHDRSVSDGAGTGIKPPYSGVPLTNKEHQMTHQNGQGYFNPPEWWEEQKITMLNNWVCNVKPPTIEEYNAISEYTIKLGSANHLRAFELCCNDYYKNPDNNGLQITITELGRRRTTLQNSSQWGVIYEQVKAFYMDNPVAFVVDMARSLWNVRFVDSVTVHEMFKRLFLAGKSTKQLTTAKHSKYFEDIANHFRIKHNYEIKMPIKQDGREYLK